MLNIPAGDEPDHLRLPVHGEGGGGGHEAGQAGGHHRGSPGKKGRYSCLFHLLFILQLLKSYMRQLRKVSVVNGEIFDE